MRFRLIPVLLVSLITTPGFGQTIQEKVESYLAPAVKSGDFNGVALVRKGDQEAIVVHGMADWDLGVSLTRQSRFRIASISKTFTAAAILELAEQDQLELTDPLSKYMPDFPNADRILLWHLLIHRSGVPNPDSDTCSDASLHDLVGELAAKPLWFEPATSSGYSNGGYVLLARVIEVVSKVPFEQYLEKEIMDPLELDETGPDHPRRLVKDRVRGFVPAPGPAGVQHASCEGAWAAIGGGSLLSSVDDLARWARATRDEKLFPEPQYPFGWGRREYHERPAVEQSGILGGAASYLAFYPEEDLFVVILSNVQTGSLVEIGKALGALALGEQPEELRVSPVRTSMTADQRRKWVGTFRHADIGKATIVEQDGELWLRWGDSSEQVYLQPTGPRSAWNRQDSIASEIDEEGNLRMSWGDEWQTFRRIAPDLAEP